MLTREQFDAHYDRRFATGVLDVEERRRRLRALVRTYLATMHDLQAETWIMHGSLLGWWWNGRSTFPLPSLFLLLPLSFCRNEHLASPAPPSH